MTADGTDDELIQPERLPDYTIPPPSSLEPDSAIPLTQTPSTSTAPGDGITTSDNDNDSLTTKSDNDVKLLVDNLDARVMDNKLFGKKMNRYYENGCFIGVIQYLHKRLNEL